MDTKTWLLKQWSLVVMARQNLGKFLFSLPGYSNFASQKNQMDKKSKYQSLFR